MFSTGTAYGAPANKPTPVPGIKPVPSPKTFELPPGIKETDVMVRHLPPGVNPIVQVPNFEVEKTAQTIEKVVKLEEDGERAFAQRLLDKAMASWQEAYGLSMEMKYNEGQGRALTNMCRVYLERGDYTKAKYMGENAIEVLAGSTDKKALGRARVQLARAYFGLNNPQWAGVQLDEALRILTSADVYSNSGEAADAMMLAGGVLIRIKKIKEALQFYEAAANYFAQAGDAGRAVATRVTIASFMDEYGFYMAALEEANKAMTAAKSAPNDLPCQIAALAALGMAQYDLCEYPAARSSYEQALMLVQKVKLTDVPLSPRAYIDLGYGCSLAATGDLDMARQVLERTIQPLKSAGSKHGQAQAFNVLGVIEEAQGNHGKAISYMQQALDIQNIIVPKQRKLNIILLQNLAAIEGRAGDARSAKTHLELALQMLGPKGFKSSLLKARTLTSLAEVSLKLSDPAGALAQVREAITIGTQIDDDSSLWRAYTLLAKMQLNEGQDAQAKESLASALSHFRSPQAGAFFTPERLNFVSTREDLGEQLVALIAKTGSGEQALMAAEQLKEETFSSEWIRRGGQVRAEDKDVYNDLTSLRAHLHAAESADDPKTMIKDWQDWLGRFRNLVNENRPLARLIAPIPNPVQNVLAAVKRNQSTILEYLVGADSSVVFTVEPSGRITATVLPVTRKQLQSQVTALMATYASAADASKSRILLQALYNELIPNSIRAYLPKTSEETVAIIPDGVLFNLAFAALINEQGKYLIEQHTLTSAPTISTFLDSPPKYSSDFSMLVAGAAQGNEANFIASSLGVNRLSGDLNSLQEQARGKRIVHFSSDAPIASNPMSATVPVRSDSGRNVTAGRLFASNLPNDLVVLSGTAVNAKDVQGSAVKLFSRGLSYAGARNVLMTLWDQPDNERARELLEFYKNEQQGMTQAQSLRRAQMVALSRDPSPRSWAAFQLLGPGF